MRVTKNNHLICILQFKSPFMKLIKRVRREGDAEWLKNCHRTYRMANPYTIKENSIHQKSSAKVHRVP